ncbi:MAG: exodeoxyribonuclease VII large subunit [Chryseolinea sp.]
MSELINDKRIFTLLEVARSIRKAISDRYQSTFWVKAEMNRLNHYSYSGHCYPELVEKVNGKVVAQMRGSLWRDDYLRANANFIKTLKEPLKDGITILFCGTITFDAVHGLSLRIIDIDPVFSLGELEREKLETIEKLKFENVFDLNRSLQIPLLPKRIAIISVETSKGYSDFINVLNNNQQGFKFFSFLFPALLQGDRSVDSIIAQLKRVKKVGSHFDVVAIIRGGGGDVGLSSYNHYKLASEIARFPMPVLTGIGHSTNETVSEMVAFKNAITPTELADYLIQKLHDFSNPLERAYETIISSAKQLIADERVTFRNTVRHFRSSTVSTLNLSREQIRSISKGISRNTMFMLKRNTVAGIESLKRLNRAMLNFASKQHNELSGIEKTIQVMDPVHVLRRGFSITTLKGKVISDISTVVIGDELSTTTAGGVINSTVNSKTEL